MFKWKNTIHGLFTSLTHPFPLRFDSNLIFEICYLSCVVSMKALGLLNHSSNASNRNCFSSFSCCHFLLPVRDCFLFCENCCSWTFMAYLIPPAFSKHRHCQDQSQEQPKNKKLKVNVNTARNSLDNASSMYLDVRVCLRLSLKIH